MDTLSGALRENEAIVITGWVQALDKIQGDPFGGTLQADPYRETRIAFQALLDILERKDKKAAEEQANRLVRLPALRGTGVTATIRGYYALFEAVRPVLDEAYPEGHREGLPHDIERLRSAVGLMTGLLTAAHFKLSAEWQNEWDRTAFHGLKGPVDRMTSELQALQAGAGESLPHAFREVLRDALRSSRQLLGIVESLFAMHRLGEGVIDTKPEATTLADLIGPVTEDVNRQAAADRKTVAWGSLPAGGVLADREFTRRAIVLALHRAMDETEPGGTVRIEGVTESHGISVSVRHQSQDPAPPADAPEAVEYAFARLAFEHVGGRADVARDAGNVVSVTFRFPPASAGASAGASASAPGVPAGSRPVEAAAPPPPPGIRIVRTGPAGQAPEEPAKPAPASDAPSPPSESDDPAKGSIRILRGSIAPDSLNDPGDKPGR